MKTISTLALALMLGCSAASAQFCCTTEGKTFTYAESIPEEKIEYKSTAKVLAVETAADGVVTVRMEEKEPLPGPIPTDLTSYSVYTFNPADKVTTNVIMTADDFKTTMLEVIREQVLSAGQNVTDEQMKELAAAMSVKGNLSVALPENPVVDTTFDKSVLRCSFSGQSMIITMSKGVYKGFEEVETPAGKFNCVKVEFQRKEAMGGPVVTNNITRWYAQGIGMVKMISADKKGKINAETVLCEISE